MAIKRLMILINLLVLTACAGIPEHFEIGNEVDSDFAPVHVTCNVNYIAPDKTSWTWSLPPHAMKLQNTKMLADEMYGGDSFGYALWVRDELTRQCMPANLVHYTNAYGNDVYAVESGGWLILQRKGFVAHARDQAYSEFHEIGFPNGTWYAIK